MADKPNDEKKQSDAAVIEAAKQMLKEQLPALKEALLEEIKAEMKPPTAAAIQDNIMRGANYPIPKEHRLKEPAYFYTASVGKILEPYVDDDGKVQHPPNGMGIVTFNGKLTVRMVGSEEVKTKEFVTHDARMKAWIEGHPDYGLRVFNRANNENLTAAALLNNLSASALAHFKRMSHGQLLAEATKLGVPHSTNPHTLRANVAAEYAKQRMEGMRRQQAEAAGLTKKELAMYT